MKSTGIIRNIDGLGRVVIPKEIRDYLGIDEKEPLECLLEGRNIIFKKYYERCPFCNKKEGKIKFKQFLICEKCLEELQNLKK